ncbi:MAG: hypothetical protein K8S97_07275 [Anaerolineae bacterium]|nr:hypothetical protein [Anaerolineae bacterium]
MSDRCGAVEGEAYDPPHWYQLMLPDDTLVWIWSDLLEPLGDVDILDGTDLAEAIDRAPVIHEIRIEGACDHYLYVIEWSDVDGDAYQIRRPNAAETNQYGVSGCGGTTTWSWFYCAGDRCTDEFVIVDYAGNESAVVETVVECGVEEE